MRRLAVSPIGTAVALAAAALVAAGTATSAHPAPSVSIGTACVVTRGGPQVCNGPGESSVTWSEMFAETMPGPFSGSDVR